MIDNIVFNSTHAPLWQSLLYSYYFVYNFPDHGLVNAETCGRDIINHEWLLPIVQFVGLTAIYSVYCMEHGLH
jgi:hypothetical protein